MKNLHFHFRRDFYAPSEKFQERHTHEVAKKKDLFCFVYQIYSKREKTGNIKINATVRNWFSACRFVIEKLSFLQ